jgi:hypothetical protein
MAMDLSMPIALFIAALFAALLFSAPARADDAPEKGMTFTLWHSDEGLLFGEGSRDFIFAEGDFVADTADKFEQFLMALR